MKTPLGLRAFFSFVIFFSVLRSIYAQEPAQAVQQTQAPKLWPRVAVVLSGGTALGFAHIGVIREIERAGIPIDMVLGTSMGALVGGLYAAGYSPDEMGEIARSLDWSALFSEVRDPPDDRYEKAVEGRYSLHLRTDERGLRLGRELLEGRNILALLTRLTLHVLPVQDFDALPVRYRAVATDIVTGEKVILERGSIANAMRSSMSIPILFSPYQVEGRALVDGGLTDNMPVDVARSMGADIVIAIECRPRAATDIGELDTAFATMLQTFNLSVEANMKSSREDADLLIRPDLSAFGRMSFADAAALVVQGENEARKVQPAIRILANRIAQTRPLTAPEEQANRRAMSEPPVLNRLEIIAASAEDEAIAHASFDRFVGRRLVRKEVETAILDTYANGNYTLVKLDLQPDSNATDLPDQDLEKQQIEKGAGVVATVTLEPETSALGAVLLNTKFRGAYSSSSSAEAVFSAGLLLKQFPFSNSGFLLEGGVGTDTEAYCEYYQPVGPVYFLPFFSYLNSIDSVPAGSPTSVTQSVAGGVGVGIGMGAKLNASGGWSLESDQTNGAQSQLSLLSFHIRGSNLPSLAFPEHGALSDIKVWYSSPFMGSASSFMATEITEVFAVSLTKDFTLGVSVHAATDFSGFLSAAGSLPGNHLFELRSSGMFYGLGLQEPYETGNHALGIGLEVRAKLGSIDPILGGDVFALANLSGGIIRATGNPAVDFLPVRWNPSVGTGIRVLGAFGVLFTIGLLIDPDPVNPLRPTFSVQTGSLSLLPDSRRWPGSE